MYTPHLKLEKKRFRCGTSYSKENPTSLNQLTDHFLGFRLINQFPHTIDQTNDIKPLVTQTLISFPTSPTIVSTQNVLMSTTTSKDKLYTHRSNINLKLNSLRIVKKHPISTTTTTEKHFICQEPDCGRAFKQLTHLNAHKTTHSGERPYVCTLCKKAFSRAGHLKRHLYTHTGERPYGCKVCSHRFNQKVHLLNHLRKHSGEKPFACGICDKKFTRNSYVQRHLRKTHA